MHIINIKIKKTICVSLILTLGFSNVLYAMPQNTNSSLSAWTSTQDLNILKQTKAFLMISNLDQRLIFDKNNNSDATLLPDGNIMVQNNPEDDYAQFMLNILHAETTALMQIMAKSKPNIYSAIRDKVFNDNTLLSSYREFQPNALDECFNDIIARAFAIILLKDRSIIKDKDLSNTQLNLLNEIKPIIDENKDSFFTSCFYEHALRSTEIKFFLANKGIFKKTDIFTYKKTLNEKKHDTDQPITPYELSPIHVSVKPDESYDVLMTRDVFNIQNQLLAQSIGNRIPLFVIDKGIGQKRIQNIKDYLIKSKISSDPDKNIFIVEGGEKVKDGFNGLRNMLKILDHAFNTEFSYDQTDPSKTKKLDRHSVFVLVGGGATLDMAGLAASLYHRGADYIRIPSTLLSQDDAGVGTKNGINSFGQKNSIGVFKPAESVIIDPFLLETATPQIMSDGLSEILKVTLIKDKAGFEFVEKNYKALLDLPKTLKILDRDNPDNLKLIEAAEKMIHISVKNHLNQIHIDPFEKKLARPLDYGHEWGHRLEKITDHRLSHGQGVGIGMAIDTFISYKRGYITKNEFNRILHLIKAVGLQIYDEAAVFDDLWPGLEDFRQHLGGELTISLLGEEGVLTGSEGIGKKQDVHQIDEQELKNALAFLEKADKQKYTFLNTKTSKIKKPKLNKRKRPKSTTSALANMKNALEENIDFSSFDTSRKTMDKTNASWYQSKVSKIQPLLTNHEKQNNSLILYADELIEKAAIIDIENTMRTVFLKNKVLKNTKIILFAKQKINALLLKRIIENANAHLSVTIVDQTQLNDNNNIVSDQDEVKTLINIARRKGSKNVLAIIRGPMNDPMELSSLFETEQYRVPIISISTEKGQYSFMQALVKAIQAKRDNGVKGWLIILHPIRPWSEEMENEYKTYLLTLNNLRYA